MTILLPFRMNGFRTVYLKTAYTHNVRNISSVYRENTFHQRSLKLIGSTPNIDEPSVETVEHLFILNNQLKYLERVRYSCTEIIIVESNIKPMSLYAGGLTDDYDFPDFD